MRSPSHLRAGRTFELLRMSLKVIHLIRHAESEANVRTPPIVGGRCSWAELTARGVEQARVLGERLKKAHPDDLWASSTAIRAQQTARYSLEAAGLSTDRTQTYGELEELDQGDWTGRLRTEVYTPEQIAIIEAQQWYFRPPNGESQDDVYRRTLDWLERRVLSSDHARAWVFCHGMVIKLTLAALVGLDRLTAWQIPIDNTSITTLTWDEGQWTEVVRNDVSHNPSLSAPCT